MISDPDLLRYTCIGFQNSSSDPTILAEFNSADSSLEDIARQCLQRAPPHHSVFFHCHRSQYYTFLFDTPFIFFGIFDFSVPKSYQLQFLGRLNEVLCHLVRGNPNQHKYSSHCFQGELHPIFHQLLTQSLDLDSLHVGTPPNVCVPVSGTSKGRKFLNVPLFSSRMGYKMKRLCGQERAMTESNEALVDGKAGLSDATDAKSREVTCQNGVCYVDGGGGGSGGGKQKARRIWRRHVWIILGLDFAVCLILFVIWLFVCHGFECFER